MTLKVADGLEDTFKVTDKMILTLFGRHAIFGSMSKGRKQLMNSSHMTFPKSRISLDALLDSDPIEDQKPVYTDDDIERVKTKCFLEKFCLFISSRYKESLV